MITYQNDSNFPRLSVRNVRSYELLKQDSYYVYVVHPPSNQPQSGFVFLANDYENGPARGTYIIPVMEVSLRNVPIAGYKQAYHLRIMADAARRQIATNWYVAYVHAHGGITSDLEHLEGGKTFWKSLIENAEVNAVKVSLRNRESGEVLLSNASRAADSQIWSLDTSLCDAVPVMECTIPNSTTTLNMP